MHALAAAAAVLVELDLEQGGLGPRREARDRPGVRIGLLQLVGGAVDDVLEHLLARPLRLQVAGERRPGVLGDDPLQGLADRGELDRLRRAATSSATAASKGTLQGREEGEQRRRPLPALVDPADAAVVELVGDVEGQLQVFVADRVGRIERSRRAASRWRREALAAPRTAPR